MIQPWIARELVSQKRAELGGEAFGRRQTRESRQSGSRGRMTIRAGRALVALGWRIGGSAALPATVRRPLA